VFHVEPNFFPVWKDLQRCLKHRNSLLRHDRIDLFQLSTWDKELVILTEKIHQYRLACFDKFIASFYQLLNEFISLEGIAISYVCGWDQKKSYAESLADNYERDRRQGFTHTGSHRADLKITVNGQEAAQILSRGQQKLLVCALKIAQGYIFSQLTGRKTIYLVDDLPSELDEKHRDLLAHWLNTMNTQVFITGVEGDTLASTWRKLPEVKCKMFHVEQGIVTEQGY
jgi:DNA replication and repair protein RecF